MMLETAGFDGLNATEKCGRDAINHVFISRPHQKLTAAPQSTVVSADKTPGASIDSYVFDDHSTTTEKKVEAPPLRHRAITEMILRGT